MNCYPADAPSKLGFDTLVTAIASKCLSPGAYAWAEALQPLASAAAAREQAAAIHGLQQRLVAGQPLPLPSLSDARPWLAELGMAGSYLSEQVLDKLRAWLQQLRRAQKSLGSGEDTPAALRTLASEAQPLPHLEKAIDAVLTPQGALRDNASERLANLRQELNEGSRQLRRALQKALRYAQREGWTDAPELVVRGALLLVPIEAGHKHRFQGVVHDLSSTGQTVYMEPLDALQLSNQLRELRLAEQQEIVRILTAVADTLRGDLHGLEAAFRWLTRLDGLQAAAYIAHKLDAAPATFAMPAEGLVLIDARHPLLVLAKGAASVVPLSLSLAADVPVVVISGPNAGGKSIALKATGLLQLMAQAGLPIPADSRSRLPWCTQLLADIGDDQSVQDDLSTYSSHLTHMRVFAERLDAQSLFLIDEFGTGTDPEFGGPIAEALLEAFVASGARGVVTTHYSNLKDEATAHPRIANAALQFDHTTLTPTYRLEIGLPGSSYALEMAARVGIPENLIEAARNKVGTTRADADSLLAELKEEQARVRARSGRTKFREEELEALLQAAKKAEKEAVQTKQRILAEARAEAKLLLEATRKEVKQLLKAVKAAGKHDAFVEAGILKAAADTLSAKANTLHVVEEDRINDSEEPEELVSATSLAVGDWVRVRSSGVEGEVLAVLGTEVRLSAGAFKLTLDRSQLEMLDRPVKRPATQAKTRVGMTTQTVREAANQARQSIDIRGRRVEEAAPDVLAFLDRAVLASLPSVEVIHGIGTGALKHGIRQFIHVNCPQVVQMHDAETTAGGAGVTVCQLAS